MKSKATLLLLLSGLVLGIMGLMALSTSLSAAQAAPDTVHLSQTYFDPVADAYVSEVAPTTNFGSATKLDVQNLDGGEFPDDRRSYVGFDLSTIPGEAIISSAAFKAYLYDAQGLSDVHVQLRRVTSSWAGNSVTWNKRPTSSAYAEISVGTQPRMIGWDVTDLVQDHWINRNFGASPNFGLELRGPESGGYYLRRFYSANAKADKPYLVVTYDLPTPTSIPTSTPTRTPTSTPTPTRTPTRTPTHTPTTKPPTDTPTPTWTPTDTPTPTPTATSTPEISDLDLAMVTVMNSNSYVNPETFKVAQGARFRLSVFVSIITEFSGGIETFDRDEVQVTVYGSQREPIGEQDPNGQTTFSMIRTLGNGQPTLFAGDYRTTTLLYPGLYHEHLEVVFPSHPEQFNDDGVQFQSAFSDMQIVRPDWVSDVINVQLPRLRYVQNQYNDHADPQEGYAAEYLSPGRDNDSTFLVYTFDVSTEYLNPGLWTMNVVVDEPGIIAEFNEGNNTSGEISWGIELPEFASDDEIGDIWTVPPPEGEEESVAPGPCDPWGWGGTPPTDTMAAGVYRVRYLHDIKFVWPIPPIFVPEYRDVPHLFTWNDKGVSKLTRNGVYVGEVFGPFGHHCTNTRWAGDPYQRSCLAGHYGDDLSVVGDQPYAASCDPRADDYLACREQLKKYSGRPEPWQIENVMVFFPGVLGADAGSMVTGQTGCASSLGDCSDWGPNDEANAFLYDEGDKFHLLRIKHDSIAGRLAGLVDVYPQYSPQDTLLTAVFDPEIDTTERQDNELLNALEYYIAKRTNMYDNVKVIWIAGGSRGGSTAFYLMRKIKDRLMGEYGLHHYHDSPLTIKLLATGIDAVSVLNDVQHCSPNIAGYRRLVTDAWNLGHNTHGNGHNMNVLFDQAGTRIHPNLHVLQIVGEVGFYDSMIHIGADSSSAEEDARLPAIRDADPEVIYDDLVYKYPENGLEGGFYSQWWPVFTTSPTDAPYDHNNLTKDYRPPNGPKTLNWFFNNAGWGDFIDYDELPACPSEVCDNGIDDDHNGYTDCEDVRPCRYDDHCNERNFCLNGADDDNDGLTDCDDPDCAPRARSFREPCYTVHEDCILRNLDPSTCRRATGTGLYVSPALSTVQVSGTVTVELRIGNIENLYGAQVELAFNPTLVEVVDAYDFIPGIQVQEGDFPTPDVVISNQTDNSAGAIQYAISLRGAKPGVSGSGVLARIVFHGRSKGVSQVRFTQSVLSDTQSLPIKHATQNGRVAVHKGTGVVTGRVILERRTSSAGTRVCLDGRCVVTPGDGSYSFDNVTPGAYTVPVSRMSYLRTWREVTVTAGETLSLPDVTLLGGDINQDDHIEAEDGILIGGVWNSTPAAPHWDERADITNDDAVNILDMVAVLFNWDQRAPGPWAATGLGPSLTQARLPKAPRSRAAEATTRVIISPSVATAPGLGSPIPVDIYVEDVADLYGFRVQFSFDPMIVRVRDADPRPASPGVQIIPGDFLDPFNQFVLVNTADNLQGAIDFSVTQTHPAEARDGSGVLGTIIFEGVGEGSSAVHFEQVKLLAYALPDPLEIPADAQDGMVTIASGQRSIYLPVILKSYS